MKEVKECDQEESYFLGDYYTINSLPTMDEFASIVIF